MKRSAKKRTLLREREWVGGLNWEIINYKLEYAWLGNLPTYHTPNRSDKCGQTHPNTIFLETWSHGERRTLNVNDATFNIESRNLSKLHLVWNKMKWNEKVSYCLIKTGIAENYQAWVADLFLIYFIFFIFKTFRYILTHVRENSHAQS